MLNANGVFVSAMKSRRVALAGGVCLLLSVVLVAVLSGRQSPAPAGPDAEETMPDNPVRKSQEDSREYFYLQLPNRMSVLLISDPQAEKAAVSMNVAVGFKDDPADREGLAHFLEHMLFLGTAKYPEAGAYQKFISANGGQHNAYTSFVDTNYFFDINASELEPAIDQFAQFFISPLFTEAYVEREKNAVNSEYRAKLKDEMRRGMDAARVVLNPEHPLSQFSVGNLDTLADRENSRVRDELLAFYQRYYSANRMNLVVLGNQTIEQLQLMVEQRFSAVEDRGSELESLSEPLFTEGTLPARLWVTPEQNIRRLSLSFPVPDTFSTWRAKPLQMVGEVLGHEGEGSLLQFLKSQGWAEGLSAGLAVIYRGGALFNIQVSLTEAGFAQRDDVVEAVFQTINRLRSEGISRERFDEQRKISELQFRYAERSANVRYVMSLSARMRHFPPSMALFAPYLYDSYEPDLYRDYLERLNPTNMVLTVTGPGLETPDRTELYQTPYAVAPLGEQQVRRWREAGVNPAIVLPAPNPFVPEDFERHASERADSRPEKVFDEPRLSVWQGDDSRFSLPKASVRALLQSTAATDSARHAVLLELYANLMADSLNPKLYPARLAGFHASVKASRRGLQLSVQGFSDKQIELWALLGDQLQRADFDPRRFEDVKQRLIRGWQNVRRKPPYQYLPVAQREALYQPFWSDTQRLEVVNTITLDDLVAYHRRLLREARLQVLTYGNLESAEVQRLRDVMARMVVGGTDAAAAGLSPAQDGGVAVVKLRDRSGWRFEVDLPHADAAIAWYLQGADDSNEQRALMGLTGQIVRTPFYHSLRTEQQLGYVVHAATTVLERTPGLTLVVQSPVADAGALHQASLDMLNEFGATVTAMSQTDFERQRQALLSLINRPHQNLASVAGYMWDQLLQQYLEFNRREQLSAAIEQVTLAQWQEFYRDSFLPEPRRSMLVFSPGARPMPVGAWSSLQSIGTPDTFKQQNAYRVYP